MQRLDEERSTDWALQPHLKEDRMPRKTLGTMTSRCLALAVVLGAAGATNAALAQDAKTPYPNMAPVEQYRMERDAEIALARSAAPESISRDAGVMVLGQHGYETAVQGKNGFVCLVERGWAAGVDDPDFWNPKLRGPICFNAAAVRSYVPITMKRTESVLASQSKARMSEEIQAAFDKKEFPAPEPGAMCYMLSKQQHLGRYGHWHPHLMFFVPLTDSSAWGANLPGSPIFGNGDKLNRLTVFLIPVAQWSDGTDGPKVGH
jgi:hypothetical protein